MADRPLTLPPAYGKNFITTMFMDSSSTVKSLWRHRHLLIEMAKRDVSDRYAGQIFGAAWAFLLPLASVGVFLFLFGFVLQARTGGATASSVERTIYIVSGLLPWLVVADVLARGSTIISGQANLVKQVVFPIEVLPAKVGLSAFLPFFVGQFALGIYALYAGRAPNASLFALIPLTVCLWVFANGLAFLLSAIGVFVRDLKDVVQVALLFGLYLAPIFYEIDSVPAFARPLIYANPVTWFVIGFRDVGGAIDAFHSRAWIAIPTLALATFWLGSSLFHRLKTYFGSYL